MTDERTKEALRYLGYGRKQADSLVAEKIGQAFRELERTADRRFVSREFDLSLTGDGKSGSAACTSAAGASGRI